MRRCGGPLFRAASALAGRGAGLERALAPLHTSATAAARGAWPTFGGSDHDAPAAQLGRSQRAFNPIPIVIVPQQTVSVVERFGRYNRLLESGLHVLIPVVDRVAYTWSLKEEAIPIHAQTAITRDNVAISIDGVLYLQVVDPKQASYGVESPLYAVVQLAQSAMRNELGKITLDKTFEERDALNAAIVNVINGAAASWGLRCLRYEIKDISPPASIAASMEKQAAAERQKRAAVLESEGERQSVINVAEGRKQRTILESEAAQQEIVNRANGQAAAILATAEATAAGVEAVARALAAPGGDAAARLRVAEAYVAAFANVAKASTTLLLPGGVGDPAAAIATAMAVYRHAAAPPQPLPPPAAEGAAAAAAGGGDAQAAAAAGAPEAQPPRAPAAPPRGRPVFTLAKAA